MSPRQQQIEKVFQTALTMSEAERRAFLAETCTDEQMREEVEKLLTGELMENTIAAETSEERELTGMIGRQIGVYRLVRELGRGGMGAVYLAERADGAFAQKVAVKLIKRGMDTDLVVRRFRNERQILATLNHPNITRLLDGGSTASGLPYFVMEYIAGEPLYGYCDRRRLGISERLRIFQKICDAIEEAHRHKIIHRDLKPSNILVKADGEPKLLDFGIAKLLDPEFGATAMEPTATHLRMMTPQYASPEQISGEEVTPASDIYSLGVLLYELLTGHRPYRTKSRAPYEIARAVREEEPTRPSESLTLKDNLARSDTGTSEKPTPDLIFAWRSATFETLRGALAGNLDKIVLKTLRKNPAERYQTAFALSEDISNYLEKRPVLAQSFEETEQIVFKTEQPAKNSIAILPFKLLGSAQPDETGDEYLSIGLADALGSRLSGVKRLTVRPTSSILRYANSADPFAAGRELNVEFIVDGSIRRSGERIRVSVQLLCIGENAARWAQTFDEKMTDVLEIEDSISERVVKILISHLTGEEKNQLAKRATNNAEAYEAYLRGRYHWNQFTVAGFTKALAYYKRAIELAPDYALAYAGIADYYNFLGIYAVRPFAETTAATKKAAQQAIAFDPTLAEAYAALGFAAQLGDFDWEAADNYFRQAIELNPNYSIARVWYSYQLSMSGRFDESMEQVNKALELDPFTPIVPQTLSWVLYHARRYDEAIATTYRLIEAEPHYGLAHLFLSGVLSRSGRYAEAIKVARHAVSLLGRSTHTLCWLAAAYAAAGDEREVRELIGEIESLAAAQHYVSPYLLATVYVNLGEKEKTFELLDKAWEIRDGRLSWLAVDPHFDSLVDDARYDKILRRINHPSRNSQKTGETPTGGKEKSIAVLPLKMLGTRNADDEYLGIGLTDALISRLSNVRRFIVRPTSSILNFRENTDPLAAGGELNVDFVLDGNIRRVGSRIRVSVQLLSVRGNSTEWAQSFDEKSSDILEFEDLISEQVVKSLVPHLTGEEQQKLAKRATEKAEAYEAYLRGRFNWSLHNEEGFARAIQFYRRAVELDPNYALAFAAMTEYYIFLGIHCVIPFAEGAEPAREAAEKAVALDPNLAEGWAVLGFVEITYNWDWNAAEKYLRRAIELNPNSVTAHSWLNTVLSQHGRFDDALAEINRVLELDPDSILSLHLQAWVLYHSRHFTESLAVHRKMLKNEPNYAWGLQTLSWVLRQLGQYEEAVAASEKSVQLTGENPFYLTQLAAAYAAAGEREKAEKILARLAEISQTRFVSEYMLALVYCALGDKDKAFENLEKSLETRDGWLNWLGVDPQFDILRGDARYDDMLRRMGNPLAPPDDAKTSRAETGGVKSIAVLPLKLFGTPTGAGDDEYLGIGLTDALITRLSNVHRFVMRPTSSVLQYASEPAANPFAAGQKLAVDYVLDGSVRRSGERIRVTVQLLSMKENATVWAESFDEKSSDVLELEDSISEKVAQSLIPQLTGEERRKLEKRGTNNPEAYEAYLRGRFHWNQFTPDALIKALESYQKAINLDPNYALAYVGLADFYTWANIYGIIPSRIALEKSEAAARRAIELDDQLGEAYAALGLHTQNKQNWDEAERIYQRAVELNPNYPNAHEWVAAWLVGTGRFDEGVREILLAERLDPLSLRTKTLVAWTTYQARHHELSLAKGREIIDLDANYPQGYAQTGINLWALGRAAEAVEYLEKFAAMIPQSGLPKYNLCFAYVAAGRAEDARAVLREMQRLAAENYFKPYFLAMAHVALGERDEAFEYFEKSQAEFDPWLLWFGTEPMLESIRDDARYRDLLRRMKLTAIENGESGSKGVREKG